jgi:hypothetical protein
MEIHQKTYFDIKHGVTFSATTRGSEIDTLINRFSSIVIPLKANMTKLGNGFNGIRFTEQIRFTQKSLP